MNGNVLTNLVIPNGISTIKNYTFYNCTSFESITVPNSVSSIERYAFQGCSNLTKITLPFIGATNNENTNSHFGYIFGAISYSRNSDFVPTKLKEVIITSPCTKLSDNVFYGCSNLEYITMSNSVEIIGASAFYNCSNLKSITIPDGVKSIGESAFYGCSSLEKITIPFIGANQSGTNQTYFGYIFGNSSSNAHNSCVPETLKEVVITSPCEVINNNAFDGCSNITKVTLPKSVKIIEDAAFRDCTELKDIVIPEGVETIGDSAFSGCSNITNVLISSGVKSMGSYAFVDCSNIKNVVVPNSVVTIGKGAFGNCSSLEKITLPFIGATQEGTTQTHFGYIFGASSNSYNDDYVPLTLKEVIITSACTNISNAAFSHCDNLTKITVEESNLYYQSIDGVLFNKQKTCLITYPTGKSNLSNYTVPNGVISIAPYAFSYCKNLKSVTVPNSVTSIGFSAFYYCNSLEKITLPFIGATQGGIANTYLGYIFGAGQHANSLTCVPSTLKKVIVTSPCIALGDYAFYRCSYIEHITIPNGIISIGTSAFEGCSNLKEIVLPNTLTSIGDSSLAEITIPFVGQNADGTGYSNFGFIFSYSSDQYDQYKYIPKSLKSVTVTGSNSIAAYAFYGCNSLSRVNIFGNVSIIGASAFRSCPGLRYVTIPKTCKKIEAYAFDNCVNLEAIYFMGAVKPTINSGNDMLKDCNGWYSNSCFGTRYHTYTNNCDTSCNVCKATRTITHTYSNNCDKSCNVCGKTRTVGAHKYSNSCDTTCNYCNAKRTIKHTYSNNCDTSCNVCKATRTITHAYKTTTTKATLTKNGSVVKKCTVCGKVASNTAIKYVKTFKLSTTTYTYNGKAKTPSVTVKDSAGKTLKKNIDYTVSYASGRKNVGTYKVTIKMIGKYSGTKTLTFKINPTKTTVSKLSAGKKSITVAVAKKSTQVTGYQIQYSTSKKFTKAKIKTISSYKKTKYALKSLSAKKTYYIRVRTYKTVGKTRYYSGWSTYKYVKTK